MAKRRRNSIMVQFFHGKFTGSSFSSDVRPSATDECSAHIKRAPGVDIRVLAVFRNYFDPSVRQPRHEHHELLQGTHATPEEEEHCHSKRCGM
jgi:hypothetical protein